MPQAQRTVTLQAPWRRVREVVLDFAAYPQFVPGMHEVTVIARSERAWTVQFMLNVVRPVSYTLRLWEEPHDAGTDICWSLVEGGVFRANEGRWELRAEGEATRTSYSVQLELALRLPSQLVAQLAGPTLDEVLAAFDGRAVRG